MKFPHRSSVLLCTLCLSLSLIIVTVGLGASGAAFTTRERNKASTASLSTYSDLRPQLREPHSSHAGQPPQLGFHVDQADAQHLQAADHAGGQFIVTVFSWANIEPTPDYLYWETPDAALRAADYYDLGVVARLDQPPAWAFDPESPTPWALNAYARFVQRVVERYGDRLDGIILWNEPNLRLEWAEQMPDPVAYVALLRAGAEAARAAEPTLPVLLAGLAFTNGGDGNVNDLDYLRGIYAAGGASYFDAVALHPYGFGAPPTAAPGVDRLNFRRLELHRQIMLDYGDGDKPAWITEMGWRVRAPNPADRWQVVTPAEQATYLQDALSLVATEYGWIKRMALWQLVAAGDRYGFDFWQGADNFSPAYQAFVRRCTRMPACHTNSTTTTAGTSSQAPSRPIITTEILAPDVIVRLGDRDDLHPHWVHLLSGSDSGANDGQEPSPANRRLQWGGEFFVPLTALSIAQGATISRTATSSSPPMPTITLLLETMQIDQPLNGVYINGNALGTLAARPRPDPTSTWLTQRVTVPHTLLRSGLNTLTIRAGARNPAWQYDVWRWENFQVRNIRLSWTRANEEQRQMPLIPRWQPVKTPGGWAESIRLRPGTGQSFWLTGNRLGQLWQAQRDPNAAMGWRIENEAGSGKAWRFHDVLEWKEQTFVATDRGVWQRKDNHREWQPITGLPQANAGVLITGTIASDTALYAGFTERGLWRATTPTGPWQQIGTQGMTVLDLAHGVDGALYVATPTALYRISPTALEQQTPAVTHWELLPPLPSTLGTNFATRLYSHTTHTTMAADGETRPVHPLLVARIDDQLWQWDGARWSPFGPPAMEERARQSALYGCCGAGTIVGGSDMPLWQLGANGTWQASSVVVDGSPWQMATTTPVESTGAPELTQALASLELTDLLEIDGELIMAGATGLFVSTFNRTTGVLGPLNVIPGLPATVSNLWLDPTQPTRWLAATPVGLYRTVNAGTSWQSISPPWVLHDMAIRADGRLFLARAQGIAWTDTIWDATVQWHESRGYERVYFFNVTPHPTEPNRVWAGTWGNDIGVSQDGGATMMGLGNGLETLSVLDIWWHATPGQITIATIEGLYRSDDGGEHWFRLPGPLTEQTIYALRQDDAGRLWAGAADGLWYSDDYGVRWRPVQELAGVTITTIGSLNNAEGEEQLWAGTEGAGWWLHRADNGGSWQLAGLPGRTVYQVQMLAPQPKLQASDLIAATDQGLFRTQLTSLE